MKATPRAKAKSPLDDNYESVYDFCLSQLQQSEIRLEGVKKHFESLRTHEENVLELRTLLRRRDEEILELQTLIHKTKHSYLELISEVDELRNDNAILKEVEQSDRIKINKLLAIIKKANLGLINVSYFTEREPWIAQIRPTAAKEHGRINVDVTLAEDIERLPPSPSASCLLPSPSELANIKGDNEREIINTLCTKLCTFVEEYKRSYSIWILQQEKMREKHKFDLEEAYNLQRAEKKRQLEACQKVTEVTCLYENRVRELSECLLKKERSDIRNKQVIEDIQQERYSAMDSESSRKVKADNVLSHVRKQLQEKEYELYRVHDSLKQQQAAHERRAKSQEEKYSNLARKCEMLSQMRYYGFRGFEASLNQLKVALENISKKYFFDVTTANRTEFHLPPQLEAFCTMAAPPPKKLTAKPKRSAARPRSASPTKLTRRKPPKVVEAAKMKRTVKFDDECIELGSASDSTPSKASEEDRREYVRQVIGSAMDAIERIRLSMPTLENTGNVYTSSS